MIHLFKRFLQLFVATVLLLFLCVPVSSYAAETEKDLSVQLTGLYAGIGVSIFSGQTNYPATAYGDGTYFIEEDFVQFEREEYRFTETNPAGSFFVGYNYFWKDILLGIEGDITFTDFNSSHSINTLYDSVPVPFSMTSKVRASWFASIAPKIGYRYNNSLFFVLGGAAFSHFRYSFSFRDEFGAGHHSAGSKSASRTGWVVGAGYEHTLEDHWALRFDYRYYRFDDIFNNFKTPLGPDELHDGFSHSLKFEANMFRVSVIRKF